MAVLDSLGGPHRKARAVLDTEGNLVVVWATSMSENQADVYHQGKFIALKLDGATGNEI